jgi:hypothetical protein
MTGVLILMGGIVAFGFVLLILGIRGERYDREQRQRSARP